MPPYPSRRLRHNLALLGNVLVLVGFFILDIRDLLFKISWLGPWDTFSFSATAGVVIPTAPLVPLVAVNRSSYGERIRRSSGWSSYLVSCDAIHGPTFFLHALGANCSIGNDGDGLVAPKLFMSSGVRVDSVAWAACSLLYYHRRPEVCQEKIVTQFLRRYYMAAPHIRPHDMAKAGSPAEIELLRLLDVIGASRPTHKIICVEAVQYRSPGPYKAELFGCASPNYAFSAFAGHYAKHFVTLMEDKTWLTLDHINIMGLRIQIRQNDQSAYHLSTDDDGRIVGQHITMVNFSASGHLYNILVVIDIGLALMHVLSAVEIFQMLLLPRFRFASNKLTTKIDTSDFGDGSYFSMFSRSLYRSRPVVYLTLASHLISWPMIISNAVIWTWSISARGKLQAYLSSIRVWVLLLIAFNALWDLVVFCRERWAWLIARRTYITTLELMVIGAIIAYLNRVSIFSIGERKYAIERQRLVDSSSFHDATGFANVYNDNQDFVLTTSLPVLSAVYLPLFRSMGISLVVLYAYVFVKLLVLRLWNRRSTVAPLPSTSTAAAATTTEGDPASNEAGGDDDDDDDDEDGDDYERLPIEGLVAIPVRARSLLRSGLEMEYERGDVWYLRAPMLFDYGVLVDLHGDIRTRVGFLEVIPPSVDLTAYFQRGERSFSLRSRPLLHDDTNRRERGATINDSAATSATGSSSSNSSAAATAGASPQVPKRRSSVQFGGQELSPEAAAGRPSTLGIDWSLVPRPTSFHGGGGGDARRRSVGSRP